MAARSFDLVFYRRSPGMALGAQPPHAAGRRGKILWDCRLLFFVGCHWEGISGKRNARLVKLTGDLYRKIILRLTPPIIIVGLNTPWQAHIACAIQTTAPPAARKNRCYVTCFFQYHHPKMTGGGTVINCKIKAMGFWLVIWNIPRIPAKKSNVPKHTPNKKNINPKKTFTKKAE